MIESTSCASLFTDEEEFNAFTHMLIGKFKNRQQKEPVVLVGRALHMISDGDLLEDDTFNDAVHTIDLMAHDFFSLLFLQVWLLPLEAYWAAAEKPALFRLRCLSMHVETMIAPFNKATGKKMIPCAVCEEKEKAAALKMNTWMSSQDD